ncbi:UbiD family decarboxylase [Chloroflexota bacterium]
MFKDLRDYIQAVEEIGELKIIEGASWDLEIGAIGEIYAESNESPMLLFDKIPGYPAGYRVAHNLFASQRRTALGLGLPHEAKGIELVKALRGKIKSLRPLIPPIETETAPVKENILTGDDVDLFKFPVPKWHELDGGRYIGTGSAVITRDPDEGWVNFGAYRVELHEKNVATIQIAAGQDGDIIQKKYWARGMNCPAAVSCGQEPVIFSASGWQRTPWGISEYDIAGALKGAPIEVTAGPFTGFPIPATAEIVLEGEIVPPEVDSRVEGPFGEWPGYYASAAKTIPAFRVKTILHRDNPIIQGNPPSRLPAVWTLGRHIQKAATLWDHLDQQLPGVCGVWMIEEAGVHSIPVISLKQAYPGHAKQAALVAASSNATGFETKFIIVVDDDIDPSNLSEVWWALGTRTEPELTIDILRDMWGTALNPMLPEELKMKGELKRSVGIIIACKPYHRLNVFPLASRCSPEYLAKIREKWQL